MVTAVPRLLIVGLGNLPMPLTRHSVGQLIVDSLSFRLGIPLVSNRSLGGLFGQKQVVVGDTEILLSLFKSKSLMNISGPSIAKTMRETVGSPSSMLVVTDSLSHKVEAISLKRGGSANGHNGVKSIISALGNDMNFHRLRIGIGRDGSDAADYVLRKLSPHEKQYWDSSGEGIDLVMNAIEKVARQV